MKNNNYNQFDDEEGFKVMEIIMDPNSSLSDDEKMDLAMDYCERNLLSFKE